MNLPHNSDLPEGVLGQLRELPATWTVKGARAFTKLIDAFNVLLFVWIGRDRTRVLSRVTDLISKTDGRLSVDSTIGERSEDYAVLFLVIRHRSRDIGEGYRALQQIASRLDQEFANEDFCGEDFIPSSRARMVLEAPDRPRTLAIVSRVIADLGINLREVKSQVWKLPQKDGMCRLTFGLDLPPNKPTILDDLRAGLEQELPKGHVDFGPVRKLPPSKPRERGLKKGRRRKDI